MLLSINQIENWAIYFKDEAITVAALSSLESKERHITYLALSALENGKLLKDLKASIDDLDNIASKISAAKDKIDPNKKNTRESNINLISYKILGKISPIMVFDKIAAYRQDVHNAEEFIKILKGESVDLKKELKSFDEFKLKLSEKDKARRLQIESLQNLAFKRRCILEIYVILDHFDTLSQASKIIDLDDEILKEIKCDDSLPEKVELPDLKNEILDKLNIYKNEMSDEFYDELLIKYNIDDVSHYNFKSISEKLLSEVEDQYGPLNNDMIAKKVEVLKVDRELKKLMEQEKRYKEKYQI